MSASVCFGQTKEDIKASVDRCAKLQKSCFQEPLEKSRNREFTVLKYKFNN